MTVHKRLCKGPRTGLLIVTVMMLAIVSSIEFFPNPDCNPDIDVIVLPDRQPSGEPTIGTAKKLPLKTTQEAVRLLDRIRDELSEQFKDHIVNPSKKARLAEVKIHQAVEETQEPVHRKPASTVQNVTPAIVQKNTQKSVEKEFQKPIQKKIQEPIQKKIQEPVEKSQEPVEKSQEPVQEGNHKTVDPVGNESSARQCKLIQESLYSDSDKSKVTLSAKGYCRKYDTGVEICCSVATPESHHHNTELQTDLSDDPVPPKVKYEKSCDGVVRSLGSTNQEKRIECNNKACCERHDDETTFCCPISKILKMINARKSIVTPKVPDDEPIPDQEGVRDPNSLPSPSTTSFTAFALITINIVANGIQAIGF